MPRPVRKRCQRKSHSCLFGRGQDLDKVQSMGMATARVSPASLPMAWEITGIFAQNNHAQEEQKSRGARNYVVCTDKVGTKFCWKTEYATEALSRLCDIFIPNNVRELCDECFCGCSKLCRVAFGPSSSLVRMGVSCFELTKIREVTIPDSVRQLGDRCFYLCESLSRVTFGPSSSLESIGVSCFWGTCVRNVCIPDSVQELCDQCSCDIFSFIVS